MEEVSLEVGFKVSKAHAIPNWEFSLFCFMVVSTWKLSATAPAACPCHDENGLNL